MADVKRANNHLDEVSHARIKHGKFATNDAQLAVDRATDANSEQINPQRSLVERCVACVDHGRIGQHAQRRQRGICAGKRVRKDSCDAASITVARSKVAARHCTHVTIVALRRRLLGVVPAERAMTAAAGQEKRTIVILPTKPLVIIERLGQEHLVARTAELIGAMHRILEKGALVKRGLRLHQLVRGPRKQRRIAGRKRIVRALLNRVIAVAARTIDGDDAVTHGAGDACTTERIGGNVVRGIVPLRILKATGEEWNWIVASRAEARVLNAVFARESLQSSFAHAGGVERIVEGTRGMRRVRP